MTIIKVGGSLFNHPALGEGLRQYVDTLPTPILIVPGGGPFADVVRSLDSIHQLGEERAHWLAIKSLEVSALLVQGWLPASTLVKMPGQPFQLGILEAHAFCQLDEGYSGSLPHLWDVTTDSIAARVASTFRADKLILLKSIDVPDNCVWAEAVAQRWVDPFFPTAIEPFDGSIEFVNFRRWLDDYHLARNA